MLNQSKRNIKQHFINNMTGTRSSSQRLLYVDKVIMNYAYTYLLHSFFIFSCLSERDHPLLLTCLLLKAYGLNCS